MLLRCQASLVGSRVAEFLKFTYFVSKPGKCFIIYGIEVMPIRRARFADAAVVRTCLPFSRKNHHSISLRSSAGVFRRPCGYQV